MAIVGHDKQGAILVARSGYDVVRLSLECGRLTCSGLWLRRHLHRLVRHSEAPAAPVLPPLVDLYVCWRVDECESIVARLVLPSSSTAHTAQRSL